MNIFKALSAILFSILFTINFSFSQNNNSSPFKLDTGTETILLTSGAVLGITALAILLNSDPLTKEQINKLNPDDVNSFDRSFLGVYNEDELGDVLLYSSYLLPLTFLTNSETKKDFGDLSLMYGEVLLLNASINGIVKGLSERIRPFVYDERSPLEEKTTVDAKLSFYSGHTSSTASNTFFTAKVFSEYLTDETTKVLIWSAAALIPAITGVSRVNNHWHFPTDVIVGYIVGAAIGYIIPLIHKIDNDNTDPSQNIYRPMIGFQIKF